MLPSGLSLPRTPPAAHRHDSRVGVWVLVVLTAGAYLPSPLYPGYQQLFAFSDLTTTVIYATFALVSAPALVLFGQACDAVGPRLVLRCGVLASAVGSVCFALAAGAGWLVLARAAHGLALGAATGAAGVVIGRGAPTRSALLASTAFLVGTAAGPVAGGLLGSVDSGALPYLVHLLLLGVVWHRVSSLESGSGTRRWRVRAPRVPAGLRAVFASAALNGFLAWTVLGLFMSLIPGLLRAGPALTGMVLGAVVSCSALVQPLVGRLGQRRAQLSGLGALLVSLVLLAVTAGSSAVAMAPMAVAAGIGHGLTYGGASAALTDRVPEQQRGGITGALYLAFYLGAGLPAVAVGLLTVAWPLVTAMTCIATAAALLVPVAARCQLKLRPPASADQGLS